MLFQAFLTMWSGRQTPAALGGGREESLLPTSKVGKLSLSVSFSDLPKAQRGSPGRHAQLLRPQEQASLF